MGRLIHTAILMKDAMDTSFIKELDLQNQLMFFEVKDVKFEQQSSDGIYAGHFVMPFIMNYEAFLGCLEKAYNDKELMKKVNFDWKDKGKNLFNSKETTIKKVKEQLWQAFLAEYSGKTFNDKLPDNFNISMDNLFAAAKSYTTNIAWGDGSNYLNYMHFISAECDTSKDRLEVIIKVDFLFNKKENGYVFCGSNHTANVKSRLRKKLAKEQEFQNAAEIMKAVDEGKTVHWATDAYVIVKDKYNQYFIKCLPNDNYIGLTWRDGTTLNGKPEEFYTE